MTTRKKWCSGCARFLDPSEFWANRGTRDGHQDWCKSCMRSYRFTYREIEREQDRVRNGQRRAKQPTSRRIAGDTGE